MATQDDKTQQDIAHDVAADAVVSKPDQNLTGEDEEMADALRSYVPDTNEERKLVWKIDLVLLPCLWWM